MKITVRTKRKLRKKFLKKLMLNQDHIDINDYNRVVYKTNRHKKKVMYIAESLICFDSRLFNNYYLASNRFDLVIEPDEFINYRNMGYIGIEKDRVVNSLNDETYTIYNAVAITIEGDMIVKRRFLEKYDTYKRAYDYLYRSLDYSCVVQVAREKGVFNEIKN
jgi:hypothetical protein